MPGKYMAYTRPRGTPLDFPSMPDVAMANTLPGGRGGLCDLGLEILDWQDPQ